MLIECGYPLFILIGTIKWKKYLERSIRILSAQNQEGNLYCNGSRTTYPVIQGMPVMISKPEFLNPSQGYYEGR